ncbi:MAG: hypothetical protein L6R35_006761, partial [Caloplaca aegaea]
MTLGARTPRNPKPNFLSHVEAIRTGPSYGGCVTSFSCCLIGGRSTISTKRPYSTVPLVSPPKDEVQVNVSVGSSGSIPLRVRYAPRPSHNTPIILYLPSGLHPHASTKQPPHHDPLNTLSLAAHATVVHIGYRLSPQTPYPKPIHDLLASYDWVLAHLLPTTTSPTTTAPQIGVCGEHAGGSLAATLALTECHTHKPGGIAAAALGNPIVDWTCPFRSPDSHTDEYDTKSPSPLRKALHTLRARSFTQLQHQHDPFASPLLFFRTPAYDLPPSSSSSFSLSRKTPPAAAEDDDDASDKTTTPKRRSHRKYPPLESQLRLPLTRIMVGEDHPLREQGVEFAQLMRRSVDLYERDRYGGMG